MARLRAMRFAKDAMDRDWSDPGLDLDAVAAHAGYSRYHFVRAFKATYGESPGQYLSRRRIERAEELLRSANLSVTEICMAVGFTSLGTFSARFKKQTGTSPSAYRRQHGRRAAAMIPGCYAMLFTGGFKEPPPASGSPLGKRPEGTSGGAPLPDGEERNNGEALRQRR
ncbi:helix-turn-helix transcriptional regulator [Streptomyces bathyalis]|uniref:Helix-turn-helix transcriptional regulator n=2 Tax=Streptomyces bathyalis TaxID=2710756 RepID=A0A7T1TCY3_9ACTN|nr:helix-turn-helix transcriptional regulator [Streptomyces bathyalis]QPP10671.1 helix-turn-helix transcriptional regulator [Streptomyces bathyalis]